MKVAALVVLIVAVSGLEVTAGVVRRQFPEGASSEGGQAPEDASSGGVQAPEDASLDGGQAPEDASSDGVQAPEDASLDGGQAPEDASSDKKQQGRIRIRIFNVKIDVKKPSFW
ncbi:uncharacterized protein O3C94_010945 [Discoglossus pictus]